jgi:hypothetical protein
MGTLVERVVFIGVLHVSSLSAIVQLYHDHKTLREKKDWIVITNLTDKTSSLT